METNHIDKVSPLIKGSLDNRLGILLLSFIVLLIAVSLISGSLVGVMCERSAMLLSSALQNILCFMLPAWLAAYLCSSAWPEYLGVKSPMGCRQIVGVLLFLILFMPAMNALVEWNENIHLPEAFSALEQSMRSMEDNAAALTDILLGDTSVWGLISGILVVGVLTGVGEEAFFRAGIQKALTSSRMNHHVAIWLTAFIFSAIHFQFFGFFPRMVLGALFGYFYWSSQSLWVSALAHALNNSFVVVVTWLERNGHIGEGFDSLGSDSVATIVGSLFAAVGCLILFWKPLIGYGKKI